jgi:hypothetical protein
MRIAGGGAVSLCRKMAPEVRPHATFVPRRVPASASMERARLRRPNRLRLAVAAAVAAAAAGTLLPRPARAFELLGHDIIEASAYRRILELGQVPGTGVSGRTLLARLMVEGALFVPPCFDRSDPRGDCGPDGRLDLPLRFWPHVGSGEADLIINRQINEQGQCQHFMAKTSDGLTAVDPRLGVPVGLATDAYRRCARLLSTAYEGILRDPRLANVRLVGMYALMHAVEDSFSAAHTDREQNGAGGIVHLLSWKLIDWPAYFRRGIWSFPPATVHAVSDARDYRYLREGARAPDGRPCDEIFNPYAVPESCLSDRARAAVGAVTDLLVLTYSLRARAAAAGRTASLSVSEDAAAWSAFVATHLRSVVTAPDLQPIPYEPPPRPDIMVGALVSYLHDRGFGVDLYGGRLFLGPAVPFALALLGAAGYSRADGNGHLDAGVELGLLLPLVRRFAIGLEPAGFAVTCSSGVNHCTGEAFATLGQLLVPVGRSAWVGALGPRWSWQTRSLEGRWFGLGFGWAYESLPALPKHAEEDVLAWDPPSFGEVRAYRMSRTTQLLYVAATAASTANNQAVGGGLEVRWDLDRWNRRSGLAPALGIEIARGTVQGSLGDTLAILPTLRAYVLPARLAGVVVPALVRVGTMDQHATAADVAGRVGAALDVGRVELEVDSPALSYVSTARWNARPFSVRLGLMFD